MDESKAIFTGCISFQIVERILTAGAALSLPVINAATSSFVYVVHRYV